MRVAIVNRFYPPDPVMTGRMAQDLAAALRSRFPDWPILIVTTDRSYRTHANRHDQDPTITVRRIASRRQEGRRLSRLAGSMIDGFRLSREACHAADVVIALTDPPLLGYWVGRHARRSGRRWVDWTMDLFPEAFAAAGLVRESNPIHLYFQQSLRAFPPDFRLALGHGQAIFLSRTRGGVPTSVWPAGALAETPAAPPPVTAGEPVRVGYVGNIGEAHSLDMVARIVKAASPARFTFTVAASGAGATGLRQALQGRANIRFRDYLPEAELADLQVQLVSLKDPWTHLSVPSKTVTAVAAGQPFIFAGAERSDSWTLLGEAGWRLPSDTPDEAVIHAVLESVATPPDWLQRHHAATRLSEHLKGLRENALDTLCDKLATWNREVTASSP